MPTPAPSQNLIAPDSCAPGKVGQDSPSVLSEADNPARLNRSRIIVEPGKPVIRKAPVLSFSAPDTRIYERSLSALPKGKVKTYVSEARQPPLAPLTDKLEELSRDIRQHRSNHPGVQKAGSEHESKKQVSDIEKSLQEAESLQKKVRNAVWQVEKGKTSDEPGVTTCEGSISRSRTEKASSEARQLVEELKQELTAAKKQLKGFESRTRSTRRIHRTLSTLQKGQAEFHEVKPGLLTSSKEHSKHIRVLEKQLHHASSVHSGAERLLDNERTLSQRGLHLEGIRSKAENIRNKASSEIVRLKKEISTLKGSRKSAARREAKEKAETKKAKRFAQAQKRAFEKMEKQSEREVRAEQRAIDQQLKQDAVQDAKMQRKRGAKLAPTTEKKSGRAAIEGVQRERISQAKVKAEARKASTRRAVRQEKVHMPTFLAGIKGKRMSVDRLEDMIWSMRTPQDFKQAIANIQASGLDSKTRTRLRSLVGAALNGFVKNEINVRQIDNQFVAHVMFGDSMPEVLANYEKTVQRLAQKLDR